jgi:hypothetical protein
MGTWLQGFRGQHITVITVTGTEERMDTGTLLEMGEGWAQVVKDNGEMLLIPYSAIRIIKLLEMMQTVPATRVAPDADVDNHIYEPNAQTF